MEIPRVKDSAHLWHKIAHPNVTIDLSLWVSPNAIPSKNAWQHRANMIPSGFMLQVDYSLI